VGRRGPQNYLFFSRKGTVRFQRKFWTRHSKTLGKFSDFKFFQEKSFPRP